MALARDPYRTVGAENGRGQVQPLPFAAGQRGDRTVTGSAQPFEQGALCQHFLAAWCVVYRPQEFPRFVIAGAVFQADCRLRRGRQPFFRIEAGSDCTFTQPGKSCGGKERALDLTPAEVRTAVSLATGSTAYGVRPRPLAMRSTAEERAAHDAFIASTLKDKAVWLKA